MAQRVSSVRTFVQLALANHRRRPLDPPQPAWILAQDNDRYALVYCDGTTDIVTEQDITCAVSLSDPSTTSPLQNENKSNELPWQKQWDDLLVHTRDCRQVYESEKSRLFQTALLLTEKSKNPGQEWKKEDVSALDILDYLKMEKSFQFQVAAQWTLQSHDFYFIPGETSTSLMMRYRRRSYQDTALFEQIMALWKEKESTLLEATQNLQKRLSQSQLNIHETEMISCPVQLLLLKLLKTLVYQTQPSTVHIWPTLPRALLPVVEACLERKQQFSSVSEDLIITRNQVAQVLVQSKQCSAVSVQATRTIPSAVQCLSFPRARDWPEPSLDFEKDALFPHRRVFETVYAIDDIKTYVVDDALSVSREGDALWLHIHIPDIAAGLDPSLQRNLATDSIGILSQMKWNAFSWYGSVQYPNQPHDLMARSWTQKLGWMANDEERLGWTLSLRWSHSQSPHWHDYRLEPSRIRRVERLTFDQVESILNNASSQSSNEMTETVHLLWQCADKLWHQRVEQGAMDGVQLENGQTVPVSWHESLVYRYSETDTASVLSVQSSDTVDIERASRLVQECMISAGRITARYATNANFNIPLIYRAPARIITPDKFKPLLRQLATSSLLRDRLKCRSELHSALLKMPLAQPGMDSAHYTCKAIPNGMLALNEGYVQVTSPMRRMNDLLCLQSLRYAQLRLLSKDKQAHDYLPFTLNALTHHDQESLAQHFTRRQRALKQSEKTMQRHLQIEFIRRLWHRAHELGQSYLIEDQFTVMTLISDRFTPIEPVMDKAIKPKLQFKALVQEKDEKNHVLYCYVIALAMRVSVDATNAPFTVGSECVLAVRHIQPELGIQWTLSVQ